MNKRRILLVEDEGIISKDIERGLTQMLYDVCGWAVSGAEAIAMSRELKPDLVLMDIVLKGQMDGIEAAGIIHEEMDIPVIYLTAYTDQEKIERAKLTTPFAYIVKPFEDRELHSNIQIALHRHEIEKKLHQTLDEAKRLNNVCVEREFRIKELRDELERMKAVVATALSHTGKEGKDNEA